MNLSALNKNHRLSQIITDLGATNYLLVYTGAEPISPDITVSAGTLLVALPGTNPFGVVSYTVQSATINNAGGSGTNGAATITGTTGTGTRFTAAVTIAGAILSAIGSITLGGTYSVLPTLVGEPVTGGSLVGATVNLNMTVQLTANTITQTNATGTGTAGFARLAANNTAGGVGIADLTIGTSGTEAIINTVSIVTGGPIVVSSALITEA
jgi:hypothetical protein